MMNRPDAIKLGKIVKCQGKDGQLVCFFDIADPGRFAGIQFIFADIDQRLVPFHIEDLDLSGNYARIHVEDISNPEEAQTLVGRDIYLAGADLPELPGKKVYHHEIIGYTVIDSLKGEIGKVTDILERPEQYLIQVIHQKKEILVPFADEFIHKVDKAKRRIHISAPDGLIDLYLQ